MPQGFEVVQFDVGNAVAFVHPRSAFEVEIQTAEIQIYRADDRRLVVRNEILGVNESGGVFVDLHAVPQQIAVVCPGDCEHSFLVGNMRRDYPHVHTALGGED